MKIFVLQRVTRVKLYAFIGFACVLPASVWADSGVSMLFLTMPAMLAGLIPIIVLEACILGKKLGLSKKAAAMASTIANAVSTLIGVPLTWYIAYMLQDITGGSQSYGLATFFDKFLAVTWQAPWLTPYGDALDWMIPTAMLVLLVPFFFASWGIEYGIIRKMQPRLDRKVLKKACFQANLVSYLLLALYPLALYFQ